MEIFLIKEAKQQNGRKGKHLLHFVTGVMVNQISWLQLHHDKVKTACCKPHSAYTAPTFHPQRRGSGSSFPLFISSPLYSLSLNSSKALPDLGSKSSIDNSKCWSLSQGSFSHPKTFPLPDCQVLASLLKAAGWFHPPCWHNGISMLALQTPKGCGCLATSLTQKEKAESVPSNLSAIAEVPTDNWSKTENILRSLFHYRERAFWDQNLLLLSCMMGQIFCLATPSLPSRKVAETATETAERLL